MPGVGIDIATDHSIVVEVSRDGGALRLVRAAILGGYHHEPDRPVTAIKTSPLSSGVATLPSALRGRGSVVSLPSNEVMYRQTDVGSGTAGAIRALVNLEVEDITGSAKMLSGYQILDGMRSGPKALIGIAREGMVNHFANALRQTGLNVRGFSTAPVALYQCYLASGDIDEAGAQLVANIGETSVDIAVVKGPDLLAVRSIQIGVQTFVAALATALGVNAEQAKETLLTKINIKPGYAKQNVSGERAVAAAQDAAAQLFQQLDATIRYARGVSGDHSLRVTKVNLCGTGASIKGLIEFLGSRFSGSRVEIFNPLSGFDLKKLDDANREQVMRFAPAFAIPLGLARLNLEASATSVLFVPPALIARQNFLQRSVWLYAACLLLVLVLSGSVALLVKAEAASKDNRNQASEESGSYQKVRRELEEKVRSKRNVAADPLSSVPIARRENLIKQQKLIELSDARLPGLQMLRVFAQISPELPDNVTLTSYDLELVEEKVVTSSGEEYFYLTKVSMKVFIASSSVAATDVQEEISSKLKRLRAVSSVAPAPLIRESDGSGHTTEFMITLKTTDELLLEKSATMRKTNSDEGE